jgi:fructoselysine-6-P-deglycase FrlB-like protein
VNIRKELLEIPGVLRQMWEEGRPHYDALVRRVSWGERPVFMLGDGLAYPAALSGAWAFESLLGMPVIVQRPEAFNAYGSRAVARHSLVIAVAGANDSEETLAAAQKARSRGATVWAVTPNPAGELARNSDATVNNFSAEPAAEGSCSIFCRHAAMLFLAVAAAHILKAPGRQLSAQEEELGKLAHHVEWVLEQIADAGAALAKEMRSLSGIVITGGGAFYPVAIQAAGRLGQTAGAPATGIELLDFQQTFRPPLQPGSGILYLSSSRCGLKAQVHQSAREARQHGKQKILAITDGNDRQLSERADLAVLLPVLTEACGALLTLAFLEAAASFAAKSSPRAAARRGRAARP